MIDIYIVGYPRSGNTWLGYLLSDVLGCAYAYNDEDWAFIGDVTDAPYVVHKSHQITTPDLARTIFIYRDPRDVAVSVAFYLERGYLLKAIHAMTQPVSWWGVGPYLDFMKTWWYPHRAATEVRYSELHDTPIEAIKRIAFVTAGYLPTDDAIRTALERQSLPRLQARYNASDFRNGLVGEWRTRFTADTASLFSDLFGELLRDQGFEPDDAWVERFQQVQEVSI